MHALSAATMALLLTSRPDDYVEIHTRIQTHTHPASLSAQVIQSSVHSHGWTTTFARRGVTSQRSEQDVASPTAPFQ